MWRWEAAGQATLTRRRFSGNECWWIMFEFINDKVTGAQASRFDGQAVENHSSQCGTLALQSAAPRSTAMTSESKNPNNILRFAVSGLFGICLTTSVAAQP